MAWLETTNLPLPPKPPPPDIEIVLLAWRTMGGMDWNAIPVVAEMYGIHDLDLFVHQLTVIRDFANG